MKSKFIVIYIGLILSLFSFVSCNEKPVESKDGFVEASIYYYDSIHQDTIMIQTELYKHTKYRQINNVLTSITTLSSKEVSVTYYEGKLDYINRKDKISVAYEDFNGDYISIGEDINTTVLIGKNIYSCVSIFYKYKR